MNNNAEKTGSGLSRTAILNALERLSDELGRRSLTGELCLFGGTVMVLAFNARIATKDVDALFKPAREIREAAAGIAEQLGLPSDWLNDGVKGFISSRHEVLEGNLPQFKNLRLTMPTPEYLLAMKCMAGRIGTVAGESSDVPDIVFLIRQLNLKSAKEVLDLVSRYYPANQIAVKTQYLVEGLFEEGKL
jgi:hypothetical protein